MPGQQLLQVDPVHDGLDVDLVDDRLHVDLVDDRLDVDLVDDRLDVDLVDDRLDVDALDDLVDVEGADDAGGDLVGDGLDDLGRSVEQRVDQSTALAVDGDRVGLAPRARSA